MKYKWSDKSIIMIAHQKDQQYLQHIATAITNLLTSVTMINPQRWHPFTTKFLSNPDAIQRMSIVLYYSMTMLFHKETLGEEYTGIMPVPIPGVMRTCLYIVLKCIVLDHDTWLLGPFLIDGRWRELPRFLLGMRYIDWPVAKSGNDGDWLVALGIVQSIVGIVKAKQFAKTCMETLVKYRDGVLRSKKEGRRLAGKGGPLEEGSADTVVYRKCSIKCILCLEGASDVTVTPCGHLFCWRCIQEWLMVNDQCPMCKHQHLKMASCYTLRLSASQQAHEIK